MDLACAFGTSEKNIENLSKKINQHQWTLTKQAIGIECQGYLGIRQV